MSTGKHRFILILWAVLLTFAGPAVLETAYAAPAVAFTKAVSTAPSAAPAKKLRAAIDSLTKRYTLTIDNPNFDLEQFKLEMDFTGVRAWSYSGERTRSRVTLEWTFEWYDHHAVLAAYNNPTLTNKLTQKQKNLLAKCKQILETVIVTGMTDYEKELAIHDYIVLNCEFDSETANQRDTSNETPFSAYGALINGRAVCQGYTEAAYILLWMVGIENYRLENEDHTWNLVKLPDGYYHMDATWDDPEGNLPDVVRHDYFNLTDAQIRRYEHNDWFNMEKYPKAEAQAYNYFVYNNMTAKNLTELKQKITTAFKAGETEVTLWVSDHTTYAYDWTRDLQFVFSLSHNGRNVRNFTYSPPGANRDTLTVTFL